MGGTRNGQMAWSVTDLDALERNYREVVRRVGPDIKVIASVKADAYGHGALSCAKRLAAAGAYALATGDIGEAIAMRAAGIRTPILMSDTPLRYDHPSPRLGSDDAIVREDVRAGRSAFRSVG